VWQGLHGGGRPESVSESGSSPLCASYARMQTPRGSVIKRAHYPIVGEPDVDLSRCHRERNRVARDVTRRMEFSPTVCAYGDRTVLIKREKVIRRSPREKGDLLPERLPIVAAVI
jgi:hypothetical protein